MAVSLGMRISGLLVVGAVAVAAAAFTGDGSDTSDRGDGGGTIVTVGPSGRGPAGRTGSPSPSAVPGQPRPDGHVISPSATPGPLRSPDASPTPSPSPSPTPAPSKSPLDIPVWLPPGPGSPNADGVPDPSSVYDGLRAPTECRTALDVIPGAPADDEWRLLRGLASACLAVQGKGGSWETAARDFAALAGKSGTCKGRAGYTVLGGLLDFHRRYPTATVRLQAASGGTPACAYAIAGVDAGDDGQARPGETVGVELSGTYFDHGELLRDGRVFVDGRQLDGPPVLASEAGDRLVLDVVVPVVEGLPRAVDVAVRFGGAEVRAEDAFTVVAPAPTVSESATPTASVAPQGVFPLRPFPAHRARPQAAPGLRVP
ncbi:hypothetical protein [Streptomyces sp. NPDC001536]|uniref:hypothetical protein n=1 Tax=Streptomyces sp. NPDC001536 TaxID=3364583 RepID=UPI0036866A54